MSATPDTGNHYAGTRPVYAELVRERGGSWVFTNVTDSDMPSTSGYLVRLNDLQPVFDIRAAECVPQVYPDTHRCSPLHPFRNKDTGMLDKIINGSIAVGTAGKVTDLSQTYETTFDEAAFNGAVDEALLNTGLDQDRRRLLSLIDTYDSEVEQSRADLQAMARDVASTRMRSDRVEIQVQPRINGVTEYFQDDIAFEELVTVDAISGGAETKFTLNEQSVLPCDSRQCIAKLENALTALRRDVLEQTDRLTAEMQPEATLYNVRCDDAGRTTYHLDLVCPMELIVVANEPATLDMDVTILARDFDHLLPSFAVADDNIEVKIDGNTATFTNISTEYLTVGASTVYYNSKTHTTSGPVDIAPGISVTRDVRDFLSPALVIESSYKSMTPDKAAGASFRFGFAVRYRSASEVEEQTLHDLRDYNVGCVINDRIRPGSCRPQAVAQSDAPALDQTDARPKARY